MTERDKESLLKNARRLEARIIERVRGPALALLTKVSAAFTAATAQPVVKIRAGNGQTVPAGPTPDAPVMIWGTGGFELSACIDANDVALSVPLESDHTGYFKTGKISDPASPRVHDRGLAVSLPFSPRKIVSAGQGELFLGIGSKKLYLKINRDSLLLELNVDGVGARMNFGRLATRGAARVDDTVGKTLLMQTWMTQVTAACNAATAPGTVTPHVVSAIGTITGGSTKVFVE